MKEKLFLVVCLGCLCWLGSQAKNNASLTVNNFIAQCGQKTHTFSFIENKGQITDQDNKPRPDIHFKLAAANGITIFVGNGALHYQFTVTNEVGLPDGKINVAELATYVPVPEITHSAYRLDVELVAANKKR